MGRSLLIVLHNSLVCCLKFVNFISYNAHISTEKFLLTLYIFKIIINSNSTLVNNNYVFVLLLSDNDPVANTNCIFDPGAD